MVKYQSPGCYSKGVSLTRKHFEMAAKMLKANRVKKDSPTYRTLIACFKASNPRFDQVRFDNAVFSS
jgi:hypothetical protein